MAKVIAIEEPLAFDFHNFTILGQEITQCTRNGAHDLKALLETP